MREPFVAALSFDAATVRLAAAILTPFRRDIEMQSVSHQSCTDDPSYFSEKCSQCRFACLKDSDARPESDSGAPRSTLSIPGVAALVAGAAASIAGYSEVSAGLTVMGAAAIIIRIVRK